MQLFSTCLKSVQDAGNDKPYAAKKQLILLLQHFIRSLFRMRPVSSSSFQATGSLLMWPTFYLFIYFTLEVHVYIKAVLNQQTS